MLSYFAIKSVKFFTIHCTNHFIFIYNCGIFGIFYNDLRSKQQMPVILTLEKNRPSQ